MESGFALVVVVVVVVAVAVAVAGETNKKLISH